MWTKIAALQELRDNYSNIGHPIAFSNPQTIYNYFQKAIPQREIETFLSSKNVYTLHRENRRKAPEYIPMFSLRPRDLVEIDLADMIYFSPKQNNDVRYILLAIDTFTRKIFHQTLVNKNAESVLEAFKRIHQRMTSNGNRIKAICSGNVKTKYFFICLKTRFYFNFCFLKHL